MPRDYTWARKTIPRGYWTIGELAMFLGVGRHQGRRILLSARVPCRLIARRWRYGAKTYCRRAWAVEEAVVAVLFLEKQRRVYRRMGPYAAAVLRRLEAQIVDLRANLECKKSQPPDWIQREF